MPGLGANQTRTTTREPAWEEWKHIVGAFWLPTTSHGARYTFKLRWTDPQHPILKDLDQSYYATDEFYTKFGINAAQRVVFVTPAELLSPKTC